MGQGLCRDVKAEGFVINGRAVESFPTWHAWELIVSKFIATCKQFIWPIIAKDFVFLDEQCFPNKCLDLDESNECDGSSLADWSFSSPARWHDVHLVWHDYLHLVLASVLLVFHLVCIVCVEVGNNITGVDSIDVQIVVVIVIVVDVVVNIQNKGENLGIQIKSVNCLHHYHIVYFFLFWYDKTINVKKNENEVTFLTPAAKAAKSTAFPPEIIEVEEALVQDWTWWCDQNGDRYVFKSCLISLINSRKIPLSSRQLILRNLLCRGLIKVIYLVNFLIFVFWMRKISLSSLHSIFVIYPNTCPNDVLLFMQSQNVFGRVFWELRRRLLVFGG